MLYVLIMLGALYGYREPLANKVDPRCYEKEYTRAWVFFTDKGVETDDLPDVLRSLHNSLPSAATHRRLIRGSMVVDYTDIPLFDEYISMVEAHGGLLIRESKWLNSASFWIGRNDINDIAGLPCVHSIKPVGIYQGPQDFETELIDTLIFGISYNQLRMFNVDSLHQHGYFGSGVIVGVLDTGLRRTHTAIKDVTVLKEYDFLEGDRLYLDGIPITDKSGVFTGIECITTTSRLNIFLTGDTVAYQIYPVRDVLHTYSTDNGMTWTPLERVTQNFNNWARELSVCGNDTSFIFYRDRSGIQYLVFTDTTIASGTFNGTLYREPSAVYANDTVYVSYQGGSTLYLHKGTIDGFSPRIAIDSSLSNIKKPNCVSNNTYLGIFYHTYPGDSLIFLKGLLSDTVFARHYVHQGHCAQTIASGDTIFLVYEDIIKPEHVFRVAFSFSTDFGTTFSQPSYLSDSLVSIGDIAITRVGENIAVSWESQGHIYRRDSYDNGVSFTLLDTLPQDFVYLPTFFVNTGSIQHIYCTRGDSVTDGYTSGDPDYWHPKHGTEMLGLIGGYARNNYVGIAPAVHFIVAKTENPDTSPPYEYPVEEDTWVNGLEWLEANGADIVNSSLGYSDWYSWPEDFDGKHSPASIAAEQAARRGVIIVNSAGNVSIPQITIPGDAEGIITVGGIDTLMQRWQYSGYYPTPDNSLRKPEIMCLSDAPIVVNPDSTNSYLYSTGTSGASALIAGMCALLLDAHPTWSIDSVTTALYATASAADTPSDSFGYGYPDLWAAVNYSPIETLPSGATFLTPYPNPFTSDHEAVIIPFKLDESYYVEFRVYSLTGRLIKKEERDENLLPGVYDNENPLSPDAAFIWNGQDENGEYVPSGLYYCVLITFGGGSDVTKIAVVR